MFHHFLVHAALHTSRWLPKAQRLKFQIALVIFVALFLTPQLYVLTRPKTSRYCERPLLTNLTGCIIFTFMATGMAVVVTLTDPVAPSLRAAYHVFGVLSFAQGLGTSILTLSAQSCVNTTPELYYFSLVLSWACILSTVFFLVRVGAWMAQRLCPAWRGER